MASALDEDAARTVASGRETVGAMLSSAQSDLKKVFLVFLVGMLAAFFALRYYVWDALKRDILYSQMTPEIREATQVVAVTPFDVILLQVKVGMITGVLFAIPALVWVSRSALKDRGIWPSDSIPRWKLGLVGIFTVEPLLGTGEHPDFDVRVENEEGDYVRFVARTYGHARNWLDQPRLGGRLTSHWSYNEFMFRMTGLAGHVGSTSIDAESMGAGFGTLEYSTGLGL